VMRGDFAGRVTVDGLDTLAVPAAQIATHVGIVFQEPEVMLFNASVEDEVAFGLEGLGWVPAEIEARIDWALGAVGLQGMRHRSPRQLSGGEQHRLAIAAVLAVAPPVLVLDEPTAGLDPAGKATVLDVIDLVAAERSATVVMATQDGEMAARYADRLVALDQGQVLLDGTPPEVFATLTEPGRPRLDIPQMATLAAMLGPALGRRLDFVTPEAARRALAPLW
jgi:energy-coupling factor transporter ATP-binding protein EcfA2